MLVIEYAPECTFSLRESHMLAVRYDAFLKDYFIYGLRDLHDYNQPLKLYTSTQEIIRELEGVIHIQVIIMERNTTEPQRSKVHQFFYGV